MREVVKSSEGRNIKAIKLLIEREAAPTRLTRRIPPCLFVLALRLRIAP